MTQRPRSQTIKLADTKLACVVATDVQVFLCDPDDLVAPDAKPIIKVVVRNVIFFDKPRGNRKTTTTRTLFFNPDNEMLVKSPNGRKEPVRYSNHAQVIEFVKSSVANLGN